MYHELPHLLSPSSCSLYLGHPLCMASLKKRSLKVLKDLNLFIGIYIHMCVCVCINPKHVYLKRYTHPNVHSSVIYDCQDMEAT